MTKSPRTNPGDSPYPRPTCGLHLRHTLYNILYNIVESKLPLQSSPGNLTRGDYAIKSEVEWESNAHMNHFNRSMRNISLHRQRPADKLWNLSMARRLSKSPAARMRCSWHGANGVRQRERAGSRGHFLSSAPDFQWVSSGGGSC